MNKNFFTQITTKKTKNLLLLMKNAKKNYLTIKLRNYQMISQ